MRWIQIVPVTASLVSLFIVRAPRMQRTAMRALDEFASGRGYGRTDVASSEKASEGLQDRGAGNV